MLTASLFRLLPEAACDFRWVNALQQGDLQLCNNKILLYISGGLYSGFGRCLEAKNAPSIANDLALMRRASYAARSVLSKLYRRSMGTTTALEEVRGKGTDIEKYLYLKQLQRFDTLPYLGYACVACPAPRRLQQCLNPHINFHQRPHHLPSADEATIVQSLGGMPSLVLWPSELNIWPAWLAGSKSQRSTACFCSRLRRYCRLCILPQWGRLARSTTGCQSLQSASISARQTPASWTGCEPGPIRMSGAVLTAKA